MDLIVLGYVAVGLVVGVLWDWRAALSWDSSVIDTGSRGFFAMLVAMGWPFFCGCWLVGWALSQLAKVKW